MKLQGIKCKKCKDIVFSLHRHDMSYCKCGSSAIDGGFDYIKITGEVGKYERIELELPEAIKYVREKFQWTKNYNRKNQLLKRPIRAFLKDLTTDHILGILKYFTNRLECITPDPNLAGKAYVSQEWKRVHLIFIEELLYRSKKKLL